MTQEMKNHLTFLNAEIEILEREQDLLQSAYDIMIMNNTWKYKTEVQVQICDLMIRTIPLWVEQSSLKSKLHVIEYAAKVKNEREQLYKELNL